MFTRKIDDNTLQIIHHIVEELYVKTYESVNDITIREDLIQEYQSQSHAPFIMLDPEMSVLEGEKELTARLVCGTKWW